MRCFQPTEIFRRDTSFRFRIGKSRLRGPIERHRHQFFYEMVTVLEGQGIHNVDDRRYLISCGDVFMLNGTHSHSFENCRNMVIVNIMFEMDLLGGTLGALSEIPGFVSFFELEPLFRHEHQFQSRLSMTRPQLDGAMAYIDVLLHEYMARKVGYRAAIIGTLIRLLVYVARLYEGLESPHTDELLRIATVLRFIDTRYRDEITVPYLAEIAHLSVNQFHRVFHTATGTTPVDYINRRRIAEARECLLESGVSVTRLAYDLGFSDSNYFSRVFRKYVGTSPTDYRRRMD